MVSKSFWVSKCVLAATGLAFVMLTACGGGGSSAASTASPLGGVVAVGAPLAGATVTLKDATGAIKTATAAADGSYTFADVSAMTAPLMIEATGTAGGQSYTLHSVLNTKPAKGVSGVLNTTPATEAAVAQATGDDPATVFGNTAKIQAIDSAKVDAAKAKLMEAVKAVLTALGLDPTKIDLFTTQFSANGAGLDKLFDFIGFAAEKTGTTSTKITVSNKLTGGSTNTTDTGAASSVAPVPPPSSGDLAMDTSGIKTWQAAVNEQYKTLTGISSAAMLDLFATNYLKEGCDRACTINNFKGYLADGTTLHNRGSMVNAKFVDYVLSGCNATTNICDADMTFQRPSGTLSRFIMPVIYSAADQKWRAYGDQSSFAAQLDVVVQKNHTVTNGAVASSIVDSGVNFNMTGKADNTAGVPLYRSAKIEVSTDNASTWAAFAGINEKTVCGTSLGYLPYDNANNASDCSNFVPVSDTAANAMNSAKTANALQYRITAYANAGYSGTTSVRIFRPRTLLLNSTTAPVAATNSGIGITTADLGTNSVRFTSSSNMSKVQLWVHTNNVQTGNTQWGGNPLITALNGSATVAKANSACVTNGSTAAQCDGSYGANGVIQSMFLSGTDTQGRQMWFNYHP